MKVEAPWDMLSDKKIWNYLGDIDNNMEPDIVRLMLIELFDRVKKLECENNTLKVLLFESELIDENIYKEAHKAVQEFLSKRDNKKAKEVENFAKLGIPFADWVNFVTKGKFEQ